MYYMKLHKSEWVMFLCVKSSDKPFIKPPCLGTCGLNLLRPSKSSGFHGWHYDVTAGKLQVQQVLLSAAFNACLTIEGIMRAGLVRWFTRTVPDCVL